MYGKIFESIYDGTLVEDWRALITFQQLIILSSPDGIVDMTPRTISRRTGIPIEHIEAGLRILAEPDPYSRTPGNEGRRILPIDDHRDWGWEIVNHEKYKNIRTAQDRRKYMREYMKDYRKQNSLPKLTETNSKQPLALLANTDTDSYSDTDKTKDRSNSFDQWWAVYPKKVKKKTALGIWKRKKLDFCKTDLCLDIENRVKSDRQWLEGFIPHPTTYLTQERWNDEIEIQNGKNEQSGKCDGRTALERWQEKLDSGQLD